MDAQNAAAAALAPGGTDLPAEVISQAAAEEIAALAKRTVAMHVAYVGTAYKGDMPYFATAATLRRQQPFTTALRNCCMAWQDRL